MFLHMQQKNDKVGYHDIKHLVAYEKKSKVEDFTIVDVSANLDFTFNLDE